jgi:hypothetical protein
MSEPVVCFQELNAGQFDAVSDVDSKVIVLEGGYRGGKTFGLAAKAVDLARRNWPTPVVFGAPTWPMVEQVFVETLRELCEFMRIRFRWHAQKKVATLFKRRKCRIICRSLDHPRSAEGLTGSAAVVDEWELCNPQALKTVRARITKGNVCQLVLGGTPEGFGPAYDLVLKEPKPGTRCIPLPTMGNRHNLKADYIEGMREILDEAEQAEKLDGKRQSKGGLVYRRFDRKANFARCVGEREACSIELWCDFNVGAQCWFIVEHVHDAVGDRFHVAQEVIGYDVDTDQQCVRALSALADFLTRRNGRLVTAEDVKRMRIKAPCDASGRNRGVVASHASVLTSHGFRPLYPTSNPDVEDRVFSLNLAFAKRPLSLTIDEKRCPFLARAVTQQGRDKAGAPKKEKDPKNDLSGPNDAIGYGVWWWTPTFRYRPNVAEQPQANRPTFDDDVLR